MFRLGDWYSTASYYRTMDGAVSGKLVAWSSRLPWRHSSSSHKMLSQLAARPTLQLFRRQCLGRRILPLPGCLRRMRWRRYGWLHRCQPPNNGMKSCDMGVIDLGEDIPRVRSVVLEAGPGYGGYLWSENPMTPSIVTVRGLFVRRLGLRVHIWRFHKQRQSRTSDFTFSVDEWIWGNLGRIVAFLGEKLFRLLSDTESKLNFDLNNFGQPMQHLTERM